VGVGIKLLIKFTSFPKKMAGLGRVFKSFLFAKNNSKFFAN
jgi:hypothetical protein